MDYKEAYFEERIKRLKTELSLLQSRFGVLQHELTETQQELIEYQKAKSEVGVPTPAAAAAAAQEPELKRCVPRHYDDEDETVCTACEDL